MSKTKEARESKEAAAAQPATSKESNTYAAKNSELAGEVEKCRLYLQLKDTRILELDSENFQLREYIVRLEQELLRLRDYGAESRAQIECLQEQLAAESGANANLNKTAVDLSELENDPGQAIKQFASVFFKFKSEIDARMAQFDKIAEVVSKSSSLNLSQALNRPSMLNASANLSSSMRRDRRSIESSENNNAATNNSTVSLNSSSRSSDRSTDDSMPVTTLSPSTLKLFTANSIKKRDRDEEEDEFEQEEEEEEEQSVVEAKSTAAQRKSYQQQLQEEAVGSNKPMFAIHEENEDDGEDEQEEEEEEEDDEPEENLGNYSCVKLIN